MAGAGPSPSAVARLERICGRVRYPASLQHGPSAEAGGGGHGGGVPAPPSGLERHGEAGLRGGQRVGPEQRAAGGVALGTGHRVEVRQHRLEGAFRQVGHARGAASGEGALERHRRHQRGVAVPAEGRLSQRWCQPLDRLHPQLGVEAGGEHQAGAQPCRPHVVAVRLRQIERTLEGLGGCGVLTEEPERARKALQRVRALAARLCVLGRECQAGRSGRVAGRSLGLAQLGEQL